MLFSLTYLLFLINLIFKFNQINFMFMHSNRVKSDENLMKINIH